MKRKLSLFGVVIGFLFVFGIAADVHASGFAIFTQGASELGQAAAATAHGDSPSAMFLNPALINQLSGTQVEAGTTLLFPSRKAEGLFGGNSSETESKVFFPSTFYATHKVSDTVSAGIGIFNPFGLGTDWPGDWEGRYIATNSKMTTFNFNPVVSFKATPNITIAAGLDYLILNATLEKKINLSGLGLPDASQKFETRGTNDGWGYNLGALFALGKGVTAGISYRSSILVGIEGNVYHDLPATAPPQLGALFPDTTASTSIRLPQQLNAGIAYAGLEPLTVEVGMRWEGWHSFNELRIDLDQPVAGNTFSVSPRNWKDSYAFMVGGKYDISADAALLAGYLYSGNPVPDSTFEPAIPDANVNLFTIGTEVRYKKMKFSFAYGYQQYQTRAKDNSIDDNPFDGVTNPSTSANGTYRSHIHLVGVSATYVF